MKFFLPLTLLVAAGVSAQDKNCQADYIVSHCLASEQGKAQSCPATDYDCLCAAYEAVATCYNNCPNDPRAPDARHQVANYCQNASLYGTRARANKTTSALASQSTGNALLTTSDAANPTEFLSRTASANARPTSTGAADALSGSTGGVLIAVAGAVAALL
ncbi:hypothetical protein CDD83_5093 [Cordyceps sp. RAO-2017]|nr:hypothetical protein CDD83_5093 [Cordyceps sp. RAO-2017]